MSESHQRQLLIAGENPAAFNNMFSNEFLSEFMKLLKCRFGTKRVHSNIVYNEYIGYKEHIHMNSTRWETLGQFTQWLGREGYCKVDQTEKGWFIQYIDRDPMVLKRQKELEKARSREQDDEERHARQIEEMIRKGQEKEGGSSKPEFTELKRSNEEEKVAFKFGSSKLQPSTSKTTSNVKSEPSTSSGTKRKSLPEKESSKEKKRKKSAFHELAEKEKSRKNKFRMENWIFTGIIVKVTTKRLGERYHKQKGEIIDVTDDFTATVKMIKSGGKIKVDQTHLETVLPNFGRKVLILNGEYRGCTGTLDSIDEKNFCADVRICSGKYKGDKVVGIKYEDISKKADQH